jgi:hypothetical protein
LKETRLDELSIGEEGVFPPFYVRHDGLTNKNSKKT